jgi:hypothetical protein
LHRLVHSSQSAFRSRNCALLWAHCNLSLHLADGNVTMMTESLVEETAPRKQSSPSWTQHLPIAYGRHQVCVLNCFNPLVCDTFSR